MELLLCALKYFTKNGDVKNNSELCAIRPTLFTEDFAESNFMASSDDPDKPYKTYAGMNGAMVEMHRRYVDGDSKEAEAVKNLVEFADGITWEGYKRMVLKLEKENGPTLFDHDFSLNTLKAACEERGRGAGAGGWYAMGLSIGLFSGDFPMREDHPCEEISRYREIHRYISACLLPCF